MPVLLAVAVALTGSGVAYALAYDLPLEVDGEPSDRELILEDQPALDSDTEARSGSFELELSMDQDEPDTDDQQVLDEPAETPEEEADAIIQAVGTDLVTPFGIGGPAVRALDSPDQLGDWLHYNGLIFGDFTAYQADAEGALAIGGSAAFGLSGGYDVGGAYNYSAHTQLGPYTNQEGYPTLLLGGRQLSIGTGAGGGSHFNIFGGPIALSQALLDLHNTLSRRFTLYPELNSNGTESNQYHDWVVAEQDVLDAWFLEQRQTVTRFSDLLLQANDHSISLNYFSQYKSQSQNTFTYIEEADAQQVNPFLNQNLTNQSGEVDQKVLVINVASGSDVWFSDPWTANALPVSAQWAQQYELVVFNFPDAINVRMTGDPQIVSNGLGANKTHPDGHVSQAQADERHAICERVIYHFPAAQQINMTGIYLMGSVLAPIARLEANGGSINGQLICNEFETKGAMELHSLRLTRYVQTLDPPQEEKEPGRIEIYKYVYDGGVTEKALNGAEFVLLQKAGGQELYYSGNGGFTTDPDLAAVYSPVNGTAAVIENVPEGEYILREIKAPSIYRLNQTDSSNGDTYFETAVTVGKTSEVVIVKRYNELNDTDLHFMKVDADDTAVPLEGAEFTLYRILGMDYYLIYEDIVSGPNGRFTLPQLVQGRYELREVAPPDGYKGDTKLMFDVLDGGNGVLSIRPIMTVLVGAGSWDDPFLIYNESGTPDNSIYLYKYALDPENPGDTTATLAGARFDLYREDPAGSGQWTPVTHNGSRTDPEEIEIETNSAGFYVLTMMPTGVYRLVETRAPEGYYLENPHSDDSADGSFPDGYAYEFTVDDDVVYQREFISNRRKAIWLTVKKTDDQGDLLEGAGFRLSRYDDGAGQWMVLEHALITEADGVVSVKDLGEGSYQLEETSPPTGYGLLHPASIFFTVDFPASPDDPVDIQVTWGEEDNAVAVDGDSAPVSAVLSGNGLEITVENTANTRDLVVHKIDRDIFQTGVDEDVGKTYQITYLEGAVFQLQRREKGSTGDWKDYGDPFTSRLAYRTDENGDPLVDGEGNPIPDTDPYGNHRTEAVMKGLIHGTYRLVEVVFPDGYRPDDNQLTVTLENGGTGTVVYTFTITEAMAAEENGVSEYTIENTSDKPRSDLTIYKVDSDGNPLPYVPFKLWRLTAGADNWAGDMTLEEVMADFQSLEFIKYSSGGGSSSFPTSSSGKLVLEDVEPGVYVLFEHFNENIAGYLEGILYLLSHETTVAEPEDASFYYHTTVFKVVAVDQGDPGKGVRIQWVDRNKLWNGEVLFDNDANNVDNKDWIPPGNEEEYRSLTVVNKILQPVDITLRKTDKDDPSKGLAGAVFTLYEKQDFLADNGNLDAYSQVATATSASDGTVRFEGLAAGWKNPDGSPVSEGYRVDESQLLCAQYLIVETAPPEGYRGEERMIFFRLELNPLSKMLDLYLMDETGATIGYQPGYVEPAFDPDTKEVYPDGEGNPVTAGTFYTAFSLGDFANEKAHTFAFRKVADLSGTPLEGAAFTLYTCGQSHTHSEAAGHAEDCWSFYDTAVSGHDGLVVFSDLPTGVYQLVETAAPPGYDLPEGQWRIEVDADAKTITIAASGASPPPAFLYAGEQDGKADYWLLNREEFQLPIAGGSGPGLYQLVARALLQAAVLLLTAHWYCKRQNQMTKK